MGSGILDLLRTKSPFKKMSPLASPSPIPIYPFTMLLEDSSIPMRMLSKCFHIAELWLTALSAFLRSSHPSWIRSVMFVMQVPNGSKWPWLNKRTWDLSKSMKKTWKDMKAWKGLNNLKWEMIETTEKTMKNTQCHVRALRVCCQVLQDLGYDRRIWEPQAHGIEVELLPRKHRGRIRRNLTAVHNIIWKQNYNKIWYDMIWYDMIWYDVK